MVFSADVLDDIQCIEIENENSVRRVHRSLMSDIIPQKVRNRSEEAKPPPKLARTSKSKGIT